MTDKICEERQEVRSLQAPKVERWPIPLLLLDLKLHMLASFEV
jgi:hypothetical protein